MANNLYATLADYKAFVTARGQTATTDAADDAVINDLLEAASRYLDTQTGLEFSPSMGVKLYDVPGDRSLYLDDNLLAVTTLTNGDSTVITSTDYNLQPANHSPKYAITLKGSSSYSWEADADGNTEQVISVSGVWGYHKQYSQRAWASVGTLGAAITDTTTLAFTMSAGHTVTPGMILRIDSELYNVSTVATNTITPFKRGDNGSTAATHLISTVVYRWVPQEEARAAVLEIANNAYQRRFGKSTSETIQVTGAGVILTPRDIPAMAREFIETHRRIV